MIVKTMPSELSEGAKLLYSIAVLKGGTIQLDDDWKREHTVNGKRVKADPKFIPELVKAGIATTQTSHFNSEDHLYLWVTLIHKEYAHITDGGDSRDDGMYAEVTVEGSAHSSAILLLTMFGAKTRNNIGDHGNFALPVTRISVRHAHATDEEHDSSYVADLEIVNPALSGVSDIGQVTILGTLGKVLYYPRDTPVVNADIDMCDGGEYCRRGHAHPFANFTPPENENLAALSGKMVTVTMIPRRMVDTNGSIILLDKNRED